MGLYTRETIRRACFWRIIRTYYTLINDIYDRLNKFGHLVSNCRSKKRTNRYGHARRYYKNICTRRRCAGVLIDRNGRVDRYMPRCFPLNVRRARAHITHGQWFVRETLTRSRRPN